MAYYLLMIERIECLGACNNRLILEVVYYYNHVQQKEEIILYDGKINFHRGNKVKELFERDNISKAQYEHYNNVIIREVNRWCEDLGFDKLIKEI